MYLRSTVRLRRPVWFWIERSLSQYHALRAFYRREGLARLPCLGKPRYQVLDDIEARSDGCEHLV